MWRRTSIHLFSDEGILRVMYPVFSLHFAWFNPQVKSRISRRKSCTSLKKSGKKYLISPSVFRSEMTFYPIPSNVFMYQHARLPPPGLPPPGQPCKPPPSLPTIRPAQARSATCNRNFSSVPNFSSEQLDFSLGVPVPDCYGATKTAWAIDSFCCHLNPIAWSLLCT